MMKAAEFHAKAVFWRKKTSIICKRNIGCHSVSFVCRVAFFMNPFAQKDILAAFIGLFVSMRAIVVDTDLGAHQKTFLFPFLLN